MNLRICLFGAMLTTLAACGAKPPVSPAPPAPGTLAPAPASAPPAPASSAPAAPPTVFTLPASDAPVVAIRLLFRTGYADDPRDAAGLTALTAELMAKGGTQSRTAFELQETLFPWAAAIGVQVDADMTVFTANVHRDHLAAFVPVLAEVLTAPRWAPGEFERLRRDAIDDLEKRLRTSDDENLGKEALSRLLYGDHPYGRYVGGSVAGLKGMTLEAVKAHAARVFSRARLTIGVAGGFPADLPERLQAALAVLPAGEPAAALPAVVSPSDRVVLVEKDAPAVAISLGATVDYGRADADFAALMVGVSAFGEHRQFHGRLMQRMREERGLNYGDYAYPEHFSQDGWSSFPDVNIARRQQDFTLWVRPVQPADAHFALRLALHEYDKLLRDGLTEAEVKRAGQFLEGYTRLWAKNPQRRLGMALDDVFTGTPDRLEKFRAALPGLDAAKVNAALRKHLPPPERLRIAIVTAKAAAFRDALVADRPSPKTYNSEKPKALVEEDRTVSVRPLGLTADSIRIVPVGELF